MRSYLHSCPAYAGTVVAVGLCLSARQAHAYRTAADLPEIPDGAIVRWATEPVGLRLHDDEALPASLQTVEGALTRAVDVWAKPACARTPLSYGGISSGPAAPKDGSNTIQWITDGWTDRGFDPDLPGFTDVEYESTGEAWQVVEADIYLNAENFAWVQEQEPTGDALPEGTQSIVGVLTHEVGHVLGLLHPCEEDVDGVPECASDPAFALTTMYPFYAGDDDLSEDDEAGLCLLYPRPDAGAPDSGMPGVVNPCTDALLSSPECDTDDDDAGAGPVDAGTSSQDAGADALFDDRPMGASCEAATQCASGQCLAGMPGGPVCTQPCGPVTGKCPDDWYCRTVDSSSVCARMPDSGCRASGIGGDATSSPWSDMLPSCAAIIVFWRRRRASMIHD